MYSLFTVNKLISEILRIWNGKNQLGAGLNQTHANLQQENTWGIGAVFWDQDGHVLATSTYKRDGLVQPEVAKGYALYKDYDFGRELLFFAQWNFWVIMKG